MTPFFRFPRTPHIAWLGANTPRSDRVLPTEEVDVLLRGPVIVEEKIDGANLGFSVGENGTILAQNRGNHLERPFSGQFARLDDWLTTRSEGLAAALGRELILFGEWMAAVHTIRYTLLPDLFMCFDVYDRGEERFWSTQRRQALAERLGLETIAILVRGKTSLNSLQDLVRDTRSHYANGPCEGLYVRSEDSSWLSGRAKLVHPSFIQSIGEHWQRRQIEWNTLDPVRYARRG